MNPSSTSRPPHGKANVVLTFTFWFYDGVLERAILSAIIIFIDYTLEGDCCYVKDTSNR